MNIVLSFLLRYIKFVYLKNCGSQNYFTWTLATSAIFRGWNFNHSNHNRVSNFSWICQLSYEIRFGDLEWKKGGVTLHLPKLVDPHPPPRVFYGNVVGILPSKWSANIWRCISAMVSPPPVPTCLQSTEQTQL